MESAKNAIIDLRESDRELYDKFEFVKQDLTGVIHEFWQKTQEAVKSSSSKEECKERMDAIAKETAEKVEKGASFKLDKGMVFDFVCSSLVGTQLKSIPFWQIETALDEEFGEGFYDEYIKNSSAQRQLGNFLQIAHIQSLGKYLAIDGTVYHADIREQIYSPNKPEQKSILPAPPEMIQQTIDETFETISKPEPWSYNQDPGRLLCRIQSHSLKRKEEQKIQLKIMAILYDLYMRGRGGSSL